MREGRTIIEKASPFLRGRWGSEMVRRVPRVSGKRRKEVSEWWQGDSECTRMMFSVGEGRSVAEGNSKMDQTGP